MKKTNPSNIRNKIVALGLFLAAFVLTLIGAQTTQAALLDNTSLSCFNAATEGQLAPAYYFNSGGNGGSINQIIFKQSAALSYLGYFSGFGSNTTRGLNFGGSATSPEAKNNGYRNHTFTVGSVSSGTVYMAFLLRINTNPIGTRPIFAVGPNAGSGSAPGKWAGAYVTSSGQIALGKGSISVADVATNATVLTGTGTHLVVVAYTFVGAVASDDTVSLWLDPALASFGAAEGSLPTPTLTGNSGTADGSPITGVTIYSTANQGSIDADEILVGTTWADVLPTPTTICLAPVVTNLSPATITKNEGLSTTLTSAITAGDNAGVLPLLQWQRWDGVSAWTNIPGATATSYTTPTLTVAANNGDKYRFTATNACNLSFTNSITNLLTVISCDNLAIGTDTHDCTVFAGSSTNLLFIASGSLPIYQWQRWDGVSTFTNIPGATATNYTTPILFFADGTVQFRCVANSGCNASTVTSATANVVVACGTATVASNPTSATTFVGGAAVFAVTYSGPIPTYQWQSSTDGGSTFADLANETNANYTNVSAVISSPSLQYRAVLAATCNSTTTTSTPAILTVVNASSAQFRSVASGNWKSGSTWQVSYDGGTTWTNAFSGPTDANGVIAVRSNNVVTLAISDTVSVDQVTVTNGGTLVVSSNATLTITGSGTQLDVFGTLNAAGPVVTTGNLVFENGGLYQHNWTTSLTDGIPTATWNTGSTCAIIGFTSVHGAWSPSNLGQSFYNFTWNCPNDFDTVQIQLNGALTTVNGNLSHINGAVTFGNTAASSTDTLTVGGSATFTAPSAFGKVLLAGAALNTFNFNIASNLTIAAGTSVDPFNPSTTTITFTGSNPSVYTNGVAAGLGAPSRWAQNERTLSWTVPSGKKLTALTSIVSGATAVNDTAATLTINGVLDVSSNDCAALNLNGASTGRITNSGTPCRLLLGYGASVGLFTTAVALAGEFDGNITGTNISILKQGNTTITLAGANTYTNVTIVTNGILMVNGSLNPLSVVTVSNAATLSGKGTIGGATTFNSNGGGPFLRAGTYNPVLTTSDDGVLTFSGNLTLDSTSSSIFIITNGQAVSNPVHVNGQLSPGSSAVSIFSGGSLAVGTYPLFTYNTISGSFNPVPTLDVAPAGNASIAASAGVVSLVISVPPGPTITNSVSGSTLSLSWTADVPITGAWRLVSQTNSLSTGLNTNTAAWSDVPGVSGNSATITINPANPTVFYRLISP